MIAIVVNLAGLLLIAAIIWWFWFSEGSTTLTQAKNIVEIKVKDGVYEPARIQANINQPLILRFIRYDATPCAEFVIFDSLSISRSLPIEEPTDIVINISEPGEYEFTCQMGMYRGKLIMR
jgi:plastocyanin domain-containing protein